MNNQEIANFVLSCEPPIEAKIAPGFNLLEWYVNKAVEVTTKITLKDFLIHYENTQKRQKTY